jgi:predicted anti-sigma-YlaC factor YlaD
MIDFRQIPGKTMDCAEFQDRLPELFESGKDVNADEHLQTCENCAALVRDLQYIASQAKLLLPIQDPSPEVWKNIQAALQLENGSGGRSAQPPAKRS